MQDDAKELERQQKEMEEEHARREVWEAELAGSKGEAYPDDPFYGSDPADIKARRHARGAYAKEDFEPVVNPIDDYTGPQSAAEVQTYEELHSFAQYQEDLVREPHPDYDEIFDRYTLPKLKKEGVTQQEVQDWILRDPSFAEKLYQAGLELKNKARFPEGFEKMSGDEFGDWLDAQRGAAHRGESEPSEFASRREMRRLLRIKNPVAFAQALDAMKWRG